MTPRPSSVRFPHPDAPVIGALDFEEGAFGVRPRRLPRWTRAQIPDATFDFVVGMTSGVRIATRSAATEVALDLVVIGIDLLVVPPALAPIELAVDGRTRASRVVAPAEQTLVTPTGEISQERGPITILFDGLEPVEKEIELWLPHTAAVELVELRADAALSPPEDARPVWVHHGSSISQCGEASAPTATWPAIAAAAAGVSLRSLGFSGNAVGDPFVARTIRDQPADMISVEIGINVVGADLMRRRMFEPVLHGFLDTIREGHPDTPLLLIGPVPCPAVESLPGPFLIDPVSRLCMTEGRAESLERGALSLDAVRGSLQRVAAARADPRLSYLDGHLLLPPEESGDLDDGLHPNAEAYVRMGRRFARHGFPLLRASADPSHRQDGALSKAAASDR